MDEPLVGHLRFGVGRHASRLSPLQEQFAAHLLNSTCVCTERVRSKLVRADGNGRFPWEPIAPDVVPADVGHENSSDDFVFTPAAVPVAVPLPPVSVPAVIGDGAGQRQVLTVPTAETELESIRAHVSISSAPRGNMAVRRRNTSILRAHADVEWLYRYMLQNVADWRNTLSVC